MIVKSLFVEGFMQYERRCDLDFSGKPVIGIVGPNESGKSTLLQAISFCLYGHTRAKRYDQLLTVGSKKDLRVGVTLQFDDNTSLSVVRGLTRKGSTILDLEGYSGKPSELNEILLSKVGLFKSDFLALTYFQQGDIHQFMKGDKRKFFTRWTSGLKFWQDCESIIDEKLKSLLEEKEKSNTKLTSNEEIVAAESDLHDLVLGLKANLESAQKERDNKSHRRSELSAELSVMRSVSEVRAKVKRIEHTLRDLEFQGKSLKKRLEEHRDQIQRAESSHCPLLDCHCDFLEKRGEQVSANIEKALEEDTKTYNGLRQRYKELKEEKKTLVTTLKEDDANKVQAQLQQAKQELQEATEKVNTAQRQLSKAEVQSQVVKAAKLEVKAQRERLGDLSVKISDWAFLKRMVGKSGIPFIVVSHEIKKVEKKCNWVLDRLGYPKQIRFSPYRELKQWEPECLSCGASSFRSQTCLSCGTARRRKRKEELSVSVLDGVAERPFEMESSGAQILQSFAVRLACSLFLSSLTGVPFRMVMLDEVFAMLDESNRQKLMGLVVNKLAKEFGLRQQFIVSHHEDVLAAVQDLLVIERVAGSSVAKWA